MKKFSGLEETGLSDPKNSKDIYISTTARIIFRKLYPEEYGRMRNLQLNEIIAKDFASRSDSILHYFWIDKEKRVLAEIRKAGGSMYYISAVRGNRVDVLTLQSKWFQPKYHPTKNPIIEVGDE